MGVIDFAQYVNQAINAGTAIEGTAVRVIADNGTEIGNAVFKVIEGGNGVASEVGIATAEAAGGGLTTTGIAYLAIDLGVAGAAIAPTLGVAAGVGLYNIAPEFWDDVSSALVNAGKTIGGKVLAFWDGNNTYFDEDTIETFKNVLIQYDMFKSSNSFTPDDNDFTNIPLLHNGVIATDPAPLQGSVTWLDTDFEEHTMGIAPDSVNYQKIAFFVSSDSYPQHAALRYVCADPVNGTLSYTHNGKTVYYVAGSSGTVGSKQCVQYNVPTNPSAQRVLSTDYEKETAWVMIYGNEMPNPNLQPDATYPDENPFPLSYPTWRPYEYPATVEDPSELPTIYPVKYPGIGPDPYPTQDPAQDPDPEPVPEVYPEIIPDFNIPDPSPTPGPGPTPAPDPDPQPEPEPLPEPDKPSVPSDPVDPNIPPDPSVPIVVPPLPDTVNSSKLFTVYNPTSSQLDALGGYLWDSSIIAAIRDIWQEPMDGLISLQQIFVTPPTSGSHNIILGFLDSGVSSAVVSTQFVTIDCGTVSVPENKGNCTDYAPYTSLHLYLPFVGIVELDTNECMKSDISVKYKVDVYTGTCLAQVSVERQEDMPDDPILYTFSGNCSQQLPLTSGNATGMLSALVGAISTGLSVASGGGLSTLAGAQLLGNSLTHEMMHVSHSGNISANAGIMGQKKPYLIIGRRHNYDANSYNSFYGYPANKTVVLGNHSGFIRMKSGYVKTSAMKEEYEEIMRLLEEGVFL